MERDRLFPTIRRREPAVVDGAGLSMSRMWQRIHAGRGAANPGQAQPRLAQLLPPDAMGGLDAATRLLADAIANDRHIVVVGDFDCDGATACAVGVRGLRMLGARRVSHAVPNRIIHGKIGRTSCRERGWMARGATSRLNKRRR